MKHQAAVASWAADITLTLVSDAEPGTGLGTEAVNDFVPRDSSGRPHLPASHVKGLAREALRSMSAARGWPASLEQRLFGRAASDASATDDGDSGIVRFDSLSVSTGGAVSTVTRTAVSDA